MAKQLKHSGSPVWEVFLPPREVASTTLQGLVIRCETLSSLSPEFYLPNFPGPSALLHYCLLFFYFLFFWPCHVACRILVPRQGIEPVSPAVEAPSLNHWTAREVPLPFLTHSLSFLSGLFQASFKYLKLCRVS